MNVVGYIWINPQQPLDEQAIQAEKGTIAAYCKANNLQLEDFIVEKGALGAVMERPLMKQLLEGEKKGVVVSSLSSFGRRFHDVATVLSEFTHKEMRLVSVNEDIDTGRPDGQQMLRLFITIPQVASYIRPPKDGLGTSKVYVRAREVLHNGGTCPYGYTLDEATNQFVVNELEAKVVQRIFRERAMGRSLRQISNDLTRDGIPTKRGGRWQANTVKTILENVFYTGDYQCQNKIYPDDHEAIIPKDAFRAVNHNSEILQVS